MWQGNLQENESMSCLALSRLAPVFSSVSKAGKEKKAESEERKLGDRRRYIFRRGLVSTNYTLKF